MNVAASQYPSTQMLDNSRSGHRHNQTTTRGLLSIHERRRQSVPIRSGGRNSRPEFRPPAASTYGFITVTFTMKNNMSLQSPDGGAAMGGIAAHGYVNGKAGADRQG